MRLYRWMGAIALIMPGVALAHGFGALYNLPVPFWLYGWSASATLIVSFVVAGVFLSGRPPRAEAAGRDISHTVWVRGLRRLLPLLRLMSVFLLLLCIATGFFGHRDPLRNFSLTFFWIIFLLLFTYLTALLGNIYAAINPWQTITGSINRPWRGYSRGRLHYPAWLADWPALVLYMGFIWFELFGTGRPQPLATFLTIYTVLNLGGVWLVGSRAWFRHCEFFGVFLRLMALLAPFDFRRDQQSGRARLRLRWPFAGLITERPTHISTVAFALAMLATTAFDGLKATQWWVSLFWGDPTGWLTAWAGAPPVNAIATLRPWFIAWESFWLFAAPFLYLGAYLVTIWLARSLTRSTRPVSQLALDFGYTLLPIAIVYNITHYATLILTHGLKIISLASDPFGWRWDLFGTALHFRAPILPDMGVVWHSQVGLILFGHIVSVWVAHLIALRIFPSRGRALLSQLPMLALMVGFTVAGLWILAQPLTVMLLR
ncbi:MAG: hypothetical protein CMN28_08640 [Salinisphaeraceae bacterium]|nr:hypothetical protein [Salinisphaeraceae bacterium]